MKFSVGAALLAAIALAGCADQQGNPNKTAYANDPGGAVAVKPETLGTVRYDPYGKVAPFADMQAGQVAINPPPPGPTPMPMPIPNARAR